MKNSWKAFARKYPLSAMCMGSVVSGIILLFLWLLFLEVTGASGIESFLGFLTEAFFLCGMVGIAIGLAGILPVLLSVVQIASLWREVKGLEQKIELRHIDLVTIILGTIYNICFLSMLDAVMFDKNWNEILYNTQKHTPVFTESIPAVWVVILIGILGYCIVNFSSIEKIPPLRMVLGLAAMYLGTGLSIVWLIQVFKGEELPEVCLLLLPICCICITARTVMRKIKEWKCYQKQRDEINEKEEQQSFGLEKRKQGLLGRFNEMLNDAGRWPVAAFLLMWPLLGVVMGILVLFGQEPDALIKAWTETADWNLSQRTAPQNLYMDEHYLCTVAAGGHENVVKPLRLGVRHGHEVIVNRQLCVANAFEQILEEKTPRFHKAVRSFYDTYGFPIGKLIMKSKLAADVTYYVMKPLEWMFLIVLYLVDDNPENRIAVQYTGKNLNDF